MSAEAATPRVDRRALQRVDAALATLDRVIATPRTAALRAPVVLDVLAIARGLKPSVHHRQFTDLWLRELLVEHRALLAAAVEQDYAAARAAAFTAERRRA